MNLTEHKKRFYASVSPARPNSWEVDDIFELLADQEEATMDALLLHVGAIWPVSHSLCFSYLTHGANALALFPSDLLGEWVRQILANYEKKGLLGARQFMADVDRFFIGPMRGEAGVAFKEISVRMVHYICGISGRSFNFNVAQLPSTDTSTIFLPEFLNTFPDKEDNIFFYKFLLSLQWGHVDSGLFDDMISPDQVVQDVCSQYSDRRLAADLFSALQFIKVFRHLEWELPGLIRQGRHLCLKLIKEIEPCGVEKEQAVALQHLLMQCVCLDGLVEPVSLVPSVSVVPLTFLANNNGCEKIDAPEEVIVLDALPGLYETISRLSGTYTLGSAALLLGEFDFTRAGETIRIRREEEKGKFVALLSGFLEQQVALQNEEGIDDSSNNPMNLQDNLLLIMQDHQVEKSSSGKDAILIDNEWIELPAELAALIKEIESDLGALPEAYVQAAAGQAGSGINRQECDIAEELASPIPTNGHPYDEWDYRRAGYRTGWCLLSEKSLHPVRSGFVAGTLKKYQPQLKKLCRQFEMLRTRHRFVRRRRDGDDIDLDAHIEALGDTRAGLSPSDRLFVQLLRDERDIAAMFLVDMSNSTEGWVGVAIKEALVLLAEALEVVRDRYGIYGFSGMRRSRSELYHIKHLDEAYGPEVQGRIAAIGPKEYTRMGPPIRHLTKKLLETESNVRLLVVISDGKPEDYDDYKGQYAIEDTRKALLEARGSGVYSFCITIDKSAHDYLAHMFGRGNYIFVDEVLSLPTKMAEMYRLLTS
jgi:nitric oxide reductase NorD protein